MAIADRINEMYNHVGDVYDTITNVDLPTNKNIQNIPQTIKDSYLEIMNNGIDTIWNNWEKVTGSGTSISLSPTLKAPMKNELKGNTSQTGTPTPTSPIPVNVVSGDNEINVCGKNLFDKDNATNGYFTANTGVLTSGDANWKYQYIKVSPNTTYTISGITTMQYTIGASQFDKNKSFVAIAKAYINGSFTTNANTEYVGVSVRAAETNAFQLEKGSSATNFEPYQGNTYNIDLPSGMELCKIGNYQDYFYKDSDKWYLHKEIGKVVLNGSENWQYYNGIQYITSISDYKLSGLICLCSHYIAQQNVSISGDMLDKHIAFRNTVNNPNLYIKDSTYTDSTTFKTWLSTHNTSVYYVLATPTSTEITDTTLINQLEELYIAKSKENQTNISQINNDLGFIISASALKKG